MPKSEASKLEMIFDDENSAEGIDSGEESDLDRQLENEKGATRWEVNKDHRERVAIEHVLRCEVVRLRLPFCVWFLLQFLYFDQKMICGTLKISNLRQEHVFSDEIRCDPKLAKIWRVAIICSSAMEKCYFCCKRFGGDLAL